MIRTVVFLPLVLLACDDDRGWPSGCPNPNNDRVHYYSYTWEATKELCAGRTEYYCSPGTVPLHDRFPNRMARNDCGCGCYGDIPEDWADNAPPDQPE